MSLAALILGFAIVPVPARQPADSPPPSTAPSEPAPDPIDEAVRAFQTDPDAGSDPVARLLRAPETTVGTLQRLLAIDALPLKLWRDVSILTAPQQPPAVRLAAADAVARFGSRESVVLLLTLLTDPDPGVVAKARGGLVDLTGAPAERTVAEWQAWGEASKGWSDRAWTAAINARQAATRRQNAAARRAQQDEIIALYRRLHIELQPIGRSAMIAELIRDDRVWIRDLGFELASRDLSARTALGDDVARAAIDRLSHPDPRTRAAAATLITRLVPPDAMLQLAQALTAETDPRPAEPLLLAVARWPNPDSLAPTIRWLLRDDAPIDAACTALWSLIGTDHALEPSDRETVLARLRTIPLDRIGEPGMRTLIRLGDEADLDRVAGALATPDTPLRDKAAEALCESPAGADRLVSLAADDPRMFPPASRAILRHRATPDGLVVVASLPTIDPDARATAIAAIADAIPPAQLDLAVGGAHLDDALAERILSRLTEVPTLDEPGLIDGLLRLAEVRLRLARTEEAADTLAVLESARPSESQSTRLRRDRLWLDVLLGRTIDTDLRPEIKRADWLAVFARFDEQDPKRAVLAAQILERYKDELDGATRDRLTSAAQTPTPPTSPDPTPPADNPTQGASGP